MKYILYVDQAGVLRNLQAIHDINQLLARIDWCKGLERDWPVGISTPPKKKRGQIDHITVFFRGILLLPALESLKNDWTWPGVHLSFLQILALLHERNADVLDGWIQLEQELGILGPISSNKFWTDSTHRISIHSINDHQWSSCHLPHFCCHLNIVKPHPASISFSVKAAQSISTVGTFTPFLAFSLPPRTCQSSKGCFNVFGCLFVGFLLMFLISLAPKLRPSGHFHFELSVTDLFNDLYFHDPIFQQQRGPHWTSEAASLPNCFQFI